MGSWSLLLSPQGQFKVALLPNSCSCHVDRRAGKSGGRGWGTSHPLLKSPHPHL